MNFLLFKLRFSTAVHFGESDTALSLASSRETFCADTLFSALCHTALSMQGPDGLAQLCSWVKRGGLRLSDGMIFCGDTLCLPKPMARAQSAAELPAADRKAMKRLQWIPVFAFDGFAQSLAGGALFEPRRYAMQPGSMVEFSHVRLEEGENPDLYSVGTFVFAEDCGLYLIARCGDPQQAGVLRMLLDALGVSGIGGKVSSGYGRFSVIEQIDLDTAQDPQAVWLARALRADTGRYLLLTASLPRDEELDAVLDGANFALIRRGGFVGSDHYADSARKKKTQYFLAAGSLLPRRFEGDLYEVGPGGAHPVYRYGRPILLGVTL
ncbi:MAG TPA: type III-A CRISPR-associated RAMP protein Csm4 [Candidatus Pygmaiobacter gallistercoris]|nr:type III-A CRISPR-associated RAMP protein Csm4 [Candidatus Pygmaiobacter gallistercoris]